jgi:hypothetical protein
MTRGSVFALAALLAAAPTVAAASGPTLPPPRCGQRGFFPGVRSGGTVDIVGLTTDGRLLCFSENVPSVARTIGTVSGLNGDTRLVGIDFRPATGELIGLGNAGGVYTIDITNAAAQFRSQLNVMLEGASFGIDFNPTVDRLRVVSDTGQNLRINIDTGATTEDTDLLYPPPAMGTATGITAAAYTNNDASADTATTLFDIDSNLDQVVIQSPPNAGVVAATGKLVIDASSEIGFDIYSIVRTGRTTDFRAYASLISGGRARLYRINLTSGRAIYQGTFNANQQVVDITVPLNQF